MRNDRPGEHRLRDQIRFLLDTARALSREPDLDALFTRLHELVDEQFPKWSFFIALGAGTNEMHVPFYAEDGKRFEIPGRLPIEATITGEVFRSGQPVLVRTPEEFDRFATITIGPNEHPSSGSAIYAPLRVGDRTLGVISVQSKAPARYDERDLELLVAVGEQTAIAVENARRTIELDQQRRELELLVELGRGLASDEFSIEQMCRRVHDRLRTLIDARVFYVALLSENGEELHPEYCVEGETELHIETIPVKGTFAESVIASAQPLRIGDVSSDSRRHRPDRFGDSRSETHSILMLPLQIGDRCLGVLSVQSPALDAYDESAVRLLRSITGQFALAVNNVQLYRRTEERADHDALTNLYNRRYAMRRLNEELDRAARRGTRVCLLMLDVNNFKEINDTYGHPVGDMALLELANVLRRCCRSSDVISRYGGDEFLVIFPDLVEAETSPMLGRVRDELLSRALPVANGSIPLETAIGVAVSEPEMSADDLLVAADRALYADKDRARRARQAR